MDTLNLDDFAAAKRVVKLKGQQHVLKDMSVQDFVAASMEAKKTEKAGVEKTVAENITGSIKMIQRSIPTLDDATLRELNVLQLVSLVKFINGELQAEAARGVAAVPAAAPTSEGAEPAKN